MIPTAINGYANRRAEQLERLLLKIEGPSPIREAWLRLDAAILRAMPPHLRWSKREGK